MQVIKSSKLPEQHGYYQLRRSRCNYDDIISDAVTSSFPAAEMLSIETISGKLQTVLYNLSHAMCYSYGADRKLDLFRDTV